MSLWNVCPLPARFIHRWPALLVLGLCLGTWYLTAGAAQRGDNREPDPSAPGPGEFDSRPSAFSNYPSQNNDQPPEPTNTDGESNSKTAGPWDKPLLIGIVNLFVLVIGFLFIIYLLRNSREAPSNTGSSRAKPSSANGDLETLKNQIWGKFDELGNAVRSQGNSSYKPAASEGVVNALAKLTTKIDSLSQSQAAFVEASRDSSQRNSLLAAEERELDSRERAIANKEKEMEQLESVQTEDRRKLEGERQLLEREKSRFVSDQRDLADQKAKQAVKENDLVQTEQKLNARSADLEREQDKLEQQRERVTADLKELADERTALDQLHQATVAARTHLEQVRREMWPAAFLNGSLSGWREKLEDRMSEPHSPARMIYLSLAKCSTLSARNDVADLPLEMRELGRQALALELRELGRHAYEFFNQLELDADEQFRAATDWTQALEPEFAGMFFFRIVKVGQLKDQTWMTFEPSTGPVNRVISWSIQNQRRMIVQRALVE